MEELKDELREMGIGYNNAYHYPKLLTPKQVDMVLDELGIDFEIGTDWNGCDLDWSISFKFEGSKFDVWGSGYEGTMVFQKNS
jgi:hypothetical protein